MSAPLRRPLGVFLQGGGALGAWQAGALETLAGAGTVFDAVMGYSIGAVNGSALAFDRLPEALARWRALDGSALRLRPRLSPPSLCSIEPLRAFYEAARDEAAAKAALRRDFTVVTACPAEGAPLNARFTPGAAAGWDGPLVEHAAASCAIPLVFPPVDLVYRGRPVRLIDGGVPMPRPLDFSPLAACADVLVIEMVRADEVGRRWWSLWRALDQRAREAGRELVDDGLRPLLNSAAGPRVYRLPPSRRLAPMMLDFRAAGLRSLLVQGGEDAARFLADPEVFRVY